MKWNRFMIGVTAAAVTFLGSCQTNKNAQDQVSYNAGSITTETTGFSPLAETGKNTIDMALTLENPELVTSWKVEIKNGKTVYKTFGGSDSNAPPILTWDGKNEYGNLAPEGIYIAKLTGYAEKNLTFTAESTNFILDVEPPAGKLRIVPAEPVVTKSGFSTPVVITVNAVSKFASIESWSMEILNPDGKIMRSYSDIWPGNKVSWDGLTYGNVNIPGGTQYTAVAAIRDQYGNVGNITAVIRVGFTPSAESVPKQDVAASMEEGAAITPRTAGFSPNGDKALDSIVFDLKYGKPLPVKSWKVDILQNNRSVREFIGTAAEVPPEISWNGRKEDGIAADQGSYTAALSIDFGPEYKIVTVTTQPFILATDAPQGTISLSEPLFSPIESNPTITVSFQAATALTKMESWSMRIYDPEGNLFKSFEGEWPDTKVIWDGRGRSGYLVYSAEDYAVTVIVRDEFENSALLKTSIPVDILVEKTQTGYRILSSRIFFRSYTADYSSVASIYAKQNIQRLDQLSEKLKKFPGYKIKIVGHAVMIYWNNKAKGRKEQKQVLVPLSRARADAVAKALVDRGFDPSMLVTEGVGALDPLVPDSDLVNRWSNRRVSIYLDKP